MSWSKLHGGSQRHPKVVALEAALGISELEARGLVLGMWAWVIETEPSGDLSAHPPLSIARGLAWRGDPQALIDALVACRLLDRSGDTLTVHDWTEHAEGWIEAMRLRKYRDSQKKQKRTRTVRVQDSTVRVRDRTVETETETETETEKEIRTPPLPPASGAPPAAPASVAPEPLMLVPLESAQPDSRADDIRAVFAHYRARHPRAFPSPKSTSKEWSAIAARMREGFSVDDLRAAIDGCHMTPHNLGENDRGAQYLGLELIMRNGSQVTRFAETARNGPPRVVMSAREMKGHRATESWLAKKLAAREQQ